jgi:hypothetical protein
MTAPTAPKPFEMQAPATPEDFSMSAPVLPFKEEDVQKYQQEAAGRARTDAAGRALAIDVVSDPDRFNFGSMSVANRFMAKGGPVEKTARERMNDLHSTQDVQKFAEGGAVLLNFKGQPFRPGFDAFSYIKDSSGNMVAVPPTYKAPASAPASASINLAQIANTPGMGSGGIGVNIQPLPAAAAPPAPSSSASDLAKLVAPPPLQGEPAPLTPPGFVGPPAPAATSTPKPATSVAAGNQAAIAAVKAAAASTPKPAPAAVTPEIARDLMIRGMTTGVPTSEFDRYGGYNAVAAVYNNTGGTYDLKNVPKETLTSLANTVAQTGVGNLELLKKAGVPLTQAGYENMLRNGIDPTSAAEMFKEYGAIKPATPTGAKASTLPMLGASANWNTSPRLTGAGLSGVSGYTGPQPTDYSSILSAKPVGWDGTTPRASGPTGQPASGTVVPGPGSETPLAPTIVPSFMDYTSRGVGAIGDVGGIRIQGPSMPVFGNERLSGGAAINPSSYLAQTPQTSTGLAPGSAAIGPAEMPLYGAMNTMGAIGANPNLSPTMLGGQENAGMYTDRLGNRIYSPGMPPLRPPGYARGGEVDLDALAQQNAQNLSDEEPEESINTNPVGTAQQMLADLAGSGSSSPTRMAVKRTKTSAGGGASADKSMKMSTELGDAKAAPESARAQMEELARVYQLRMAAARNKARGLSADTFGAPTLEGATLTKGSLTKKRFKDGGEAKKSEAEVAEPSLFGVSDYATKASAKMFPDQLGQDDQRDAARHMLAAATVSRKYGPKAAELLGKAHEYTSNPQTFFSLFGIGQPRDDLPYDVHNNRIGAELAARATSQAELEKLVAAMARQAQTKQTKDKPYIMSREQMQARKEKAEKGMTERPEYRAKGSPEEGEVSQAELDAASRPAFVTPKSGIGRKSSTKAGDLEAAALQGVSETPYNLLGAPVDILTMAMRPFGYNVEAPMLGSEDLKRRATKAGIRQEPPKEGTAARALFNLAEIGSSAVNPAAPVRAGMKAAKAVGDKATDVAKDFQEYNRQLTVPGASYAVRPTGSTMLTGPVGLNKNVSEVDQLLQNGTSNARSVAGQNEGQQKLIEDFWGKKARNYFERQYGTPDDPIMEGIKKGTLKGEALSSDLRSGFTEHLIESMSLGKTRVKEGDRASPDFVGPGAPSTRFFPKHPRAVEEFTQRYDQATGLRGNLITMDPAAADTSYNMISSRGRAMGREAADAEADKLIGQGLRPELINTDIGVTTRSLKEPDRVINDNSTRSARDLYEAFEESSAYNKMTPEQQLEWANDQYGKGRSALRGLDPSEVGPNLLSENVLTAIEKGEPIYDIGYMGKTLQTLFKPDNINQYLASLPPRELANIRFEDAVRGGLKIGENQFRLQTMVDRIKAGKPVADKVFSDGVSSPLLQFGEGSGLDGFAWKRIEKREATVPEGAYVGHSVGGYETGGPTYTADKRNGFNTGQWRVYTLRDNRNRPVNTIEVKMLDEATPVVTQIKGNGRATGNTAPEKYDGAVLRFLQEYLKPAAIQESDSYLTPLLQNYKTELGASPRAR